MKGYDMIKKRFFIKLSILFAFSYWFFDSSVHYFGYGELEFEIIPSDFNELWMRCIIFTLFISFGIFADYHTNKIIKKNEEKYNVYKAMLSAMHHIQNNFLNKMILFRYEAENCKDFNRDTLKQYDCVVDETTMQINNLDNIQNPCMEIIEDRYMPK
jgi:hypothetical protein